MSNREQIYEAAKKKYGIKAQIIKLAEECGELVHVAAKSVNENVSTNLIADEVADVEIMCEQAKQILGIGERVKILKDEKLRRLADRVGTVFIPVFLFLILAAGSAAAVEIPEDLAVRCIVGEAAGEGAESMLWHAAAIRNKPSLKGVNGCKSDLVDREPSWVADRALQAWKRSKAEDPTKGATHWGSTILDQAWIRVMERKMVFKGQIKNTRFYKEV